MKEIGIIMSGDHPKLILDEIKTQTRRVAKFANHLAESYDHCWVYYDKKRNQWQFKGRSTFSGLVEAFILDCPYGQVGDRLWVRETWKYMGSQHDTGGKVWIGEEPPITTTIKYASDGEYKTFPVDTPYKKSYATEGNQPSIHMPRWASRITLEITDIRVERLQEIGGKDAMAEGVILPYRVHGGGDSEYYEGIAESYIYHFSALWDSLNAKRGYGWDTNCWVWVISFKRLEG